MYTHPDGTPALSKNVGTLKIYMGGENAFIPGHIPLPKNVNQVSGSSFIKLFVSTEPLRLEWIKQEHWRESGAARWPLKTEDPLPTSPRWGVLLTVLTMTTMK